ncbi:DUF2029 domain-containing protein [Kocuria coralli]|uniref:DUF2029 domain-containing protein n=1 Tax=Kocuria coralli TaxID=1461025 RepID=A0A5J5L0N2_9MICC|nr:glycosyltransferase 87 family protein [Kocuria coralli]KAA9394616.1 DUF2029 domain-containing protein [Kocuria coralli]
MPSILRGLPVAIPRPPAPSAPVPARSRAIMLAGYVAMTVAFVFYVVATRPNTGLDMEVYWRAAQVLHGVNPTATELYDPGLVNIGSALLPFTYPPISALIFSPLGGLTLEEAWQVVAPVEAVLIGVFAWLVLRLAPFARGWFGVQVVPSLIAYAVVLGLLWNLFPLRFTVALGQINTLLAILIMADLARRPSRRWGSGILTGFAAGLKVTPAAMGLVPLAQGRWRTIVGMGIGLATTIAISALFLPREVWSYFGTQLWETGRVGQEDRISNMSLNGMLHLLGFPDGVISPLRMVLILLVIVGGALAIRRISRAGDLYSATLIGALVMLLISPISWEHHWVWVAPLILAVLPAEPRNAPVWEWAVVALLIGLLLWSFTDSPYNFAAQVLGPEYTPRGQTLHGPPELERTSTIPVMVAMAAGVWLAVRPYPRPDAHARAAEEAADVEAAHEMSGEERAELTA